MCKKPLYSDVKHYFIIYIKGNYPGENFSQVSPPPHTFLNVDWLNTFLTPQNCKTVTLQFSSLSMS